MKHTTTIRPGTDARNLTVTCTCGWAHANTYFGCKDRSRVHEQFFATEHRRWNDPKRERQMPTWTRDEPLP